MKPDSIIYLVATTPLFNANDIPTFEAFDKENSLLLYSALTLNHYENLKLISDTYNSVFCFDEKDIEHIPEIITSDHLDTFFADTNKKTNYLKKLADKYSSKHLNNLIIFSNSIGISQSDISKAFNLLSMEDEAIVIGKSQNNGIAFLGFNSFNNNLFQEIDWDNLHFENLLPMVNKHENFVHVMNNYISISKLSDFKQLYTELSKKESLSYCNQEMHEKFTHLFIEYKEFLK